MVDAAPELVQPILEPLNLLTKQINVLADLKVPQGVPGSASSLRLSGPPNVPCHGVGIGVAF